MLITKLSLVFPLYLLTCIPLDIPEPPDNTDFLYINYPLFPAPSWLHESLMVFRKGGHFSIKHWQMTLWKLKHTPSMSLLYLYLPPFLLQNMIAT